MTTRDLLLSLALLCGCLLAACSSSPLGEEPSPLPGDPEPGATSIRQVTVVAQDVLPHTAHTRTNFELQADKLAFSWAEGDKIGVVPQTADAESQVGLTITSGAGGKSARFTGGGWALRTDISYVAYYPFDDATTTLSQTTFSYDGHQQTGNASLAHLGTHDLMYAAPATAVDEALTFDFKHLNSIAQLNLTLPAAATLSKLTLRCDEALLPHTATLSLTDGALTPDAESCDHTLQLALADISTTAAGQTVTCYMILPPIDMSGHTVYVILQSADRRIYQGTLLSRQLEPGRAYRFDATLVDATTSADIDAPPFGDEPIQ